jgi:predicted metal-dependent hydrolase
VETANQIRFGSELLTLRDVSVDLRPAIEKHLRKLAAKELEVRVMELAALHGIQISRVTVRNQKSRWGSCSRRGTISLNWRLIQTPDFVRDYIILHELAHRRQMDHSDKFWQEVERLCPDYLTSEKWLKTHRLNVL